MQRNGTESEAAEDGSNGEEVEVGQEGRDWSNHRTSRSNIHWKWTDGDALEILVESGHLSTTLVANY